MTDLIATVNICDGNEMNAGIGDIGFKKRAVSCELVQKYLITIVLVSVFTALFFRAAFVSMIG